MTTDCTFSHTNLVSKYPQIWLVAVVIVVVGGGFVIVVDVVLSLFICIVQSAPLGM